MGIFGRSLGEVWAYQGEVREKIGHIREKFGRCLDTLERSLGDVWAYNVLGRSLLSEPDKIRSRKLVTKLSSSTQALFLTPCPRMYLFKRVSCRSPMYSTFQTPIKMHHNSGEDLIFRKTSEYIYSYSNVSNSLYKSLYANLLQSYHINCVKQTKLL